MSKTKGHKVIGTIIVLVVLGVFNYYTGGNIQPTNNKIENIDTSEEVNGDAIKIVSWNIQHMGKSKKPHEIEYMAKKLRYVDIVAIQEVSTSSYGARAVAQLDDELDRTGADWDYIVSDPTDGPGKERYAYLWKKHKFRLKYKGLSKHKDDFDREPYIATFQTLRRGKLTLVNFHAVPTSKDPEDEIVLLNKIANDYKGNVVFMGDFNLSEKHEAFNSLKDVGYKSGFKGKKTSLKMKPKDGVVLNKEYDNFFYNCNEFTKGKSGTIKFYEDFETLKMAREISDHIPIYITLQ